MPTGEARAWSCCRTSSTGSRRCSRTCSRPRGRTPGSSGWTTRRSTCAIWPRTWSRVRRPRWPTRWAARSVWAGRSVCWCPATRCAIERILGNLHQQRGRARAGSARSRWPSDARTSSRARRHRPRRRAGPEELEAVFTRFWRARSGTGAPRRGDRAGPVDRAGRRARPRWHAHGGRGARPGGDVHVAPAAAPRRGGGPMIARSAGPRTALLAAVGLVAGLSACSSVPDLRADRAGAGGGRGRVHPVHPGDRSTPERRSLSPRTWCAASSRRTPASRTTTASPGRYLTPEAAVRWDPGRADHRCTP